MYLLLISQLCPTMAISVSHNAVIQETPPRITEPPQSIRTRLDRSVNLTCTSIGVPTPTSSWFRDSVPVLGVVTPYFYIPRVGINDRGYYTCQAQNPLGTVRSEPALLSLVGVRQYEAPITASRRRRRADSSAIDMVQYA